MMKRALPVFLALVLAFSLASCASGQKGGNDYYAIDLSARVPGDYPMFPATGRFPGSFPVYPEANRLPGELSLTLAGECLAGMAEGKCLIDPEETPSYTVDALFYGLFSENDLVTVASSRATERVYPASLTKLMTALLTLEHCHDFSARFTVSDPEITSLGAGSSLAGVRFGASYTIGELLAGLLIPSGNDAALALAVYVSGSVSAFVEKMNERALQLGMVNTHYVNPHGLYDPAHYTTVYDLYLVAREVSQYERFRTTSMAKTADFTAVYADGTFEKKTLQATNSFVLGNTPTPSGITLIGGKTGYTPEAKRCLVEIAAGPSGRIYIAVIARVDGYDLMYNRMSQILSLINLYEADNGLQ